tara:strand:- start:18 stop:338 length:321 start_codon:yes stop_codon:yes gene_type:complete
MKEEIYRSQFRLPQDLYEKLRASSERNRRSLNAELVALLEDSLKYQTEDTWITAQQAVKLQSVLTLILLDGLDISNLTAIQRQAAEALKPAAQSVIDLWPKDDQEI